MAARAWRPKSRRWDVAPPIEGTEQLGRRLRIAPLVVQILHNRGIDEVAARAFLNPKLTDLHPPELLPGTETAARRIARAADDGERIVIYGDYDVDGITAVAILHAALRMIGAKVDYYVPHRLEEGYGVNTKAVRKIIADGAKLLITVDCGISATGPLGEARAAGLDVIVTDHHSPPARLPEVLATVHPALPGHIYPNPDLSGAGVAFKLAWQVAREVCGQTRVDETMRNFLLDATCLAALGTIADVVPLRGENRVLATFGLRGLPSSKHAGLRALLKATRLTDQQLEAYHVGFMLAPRLNACGRMGHARLAVELLTDVTEQRAKQIVDYLGKQNAERQKVERAITAQATQMVTDAGLDDAEHRLIVLASKDWHGGVIGIVASRLVTRFARPVILLAVNGADAQGSGRSVPGFHMRDALAACSEHLSSFGGHAMAGGLKTKQDKIEPFTAAIGEYARRKISDEQLTPAIRIDAEVSLAALNYNVVQQLARLAPFGEGNPPPMVAIRACRLIGPPRRMGRNGQTVSLVLGQNGATLRAVGFGMGDLADHLVGVNTIDVAGRPMLNNFNGVTSVELELCDVMWD